MSSISGTMAIMALSSQPGDDTLGIGMRKGRDYSLGLREPSRPLTSLGPFSVNGLGVRA